MSVSYIIRMTTWLHVNHVNSYNFFIIDIQKRITAVSHTLAYSFLINFVSESRVMHSPPHTLMQT